MNNRVGKIYQDGTYAALNTTFGDDNAEWKINSACETIGRLGLPTTRLAEVGCGAGAILAGIAERTNATSARGFEPMPEAFAKAEKRNSNTLTFENRSIRADEPHEFDLLLCFDVFEHIEDFYSFLRDLRSMADHFLFHIPLDMNAQMVARGEPMRRVRDEVGHIHYFSKDSALAVLAEAGFVVKDHQYTAGNDGCYASRAFRLMAFPRRIVGRFRPDLAARILGGFSLMVYATPADD